MKTLMQDYSEHPLYQTLHQFWHPVAYSSEVGDKPRQVVLLDQKIVIARIEGKVSALADRCAHRGAALSNGMLVDNCFECPYHGWRYDSNGNCVRIPARNELVQVMKPRIPSYQVKESVGTVWVCLSETPRFDVPSFPEFDDPNYRLIQGPAYDWKPVRRGVSRILWIFRILHLCMTAVSAAAPVRRWTPSNPGASRSRVYCALKGRPSKSRA